MGLFRKKRGKKFYEIRFILFYFIYFFIIFCILYCKYIETFHKINRRKQIYDLIVLGCSEKINNSSNSLILYYDDPYKIFPVIGTEKNFFINYSIPKLEGDNVIILPWNKFPLISNKISLKYICSVENLNIPRCFTNLDLVYNVICIQNLFSFSDNLEKENKFYARNIVVIDDFNPFRYLSVDMSPFEKNFEIQGKLKISSRKGRGRENLKILPKETISIKYIFIHGKNALIHSSQFLFDSFDENDILSYEIEKFFNVPLKKNHIDDETIKFHDGIIESNIF